MVSLKRSSPLHALGIAALLVVTQGYAHLEQWQRGFVPFQSAPGRVTLSWDMFSVEIERCGLSWEPPSFWNGRSLNSMHDLAAPFEWDLVFDRKADYIAAGVAGCANRQPGAAITDGRFKVRCFLANGTETRDEFACPKNPE